jgi:hypothetical protein
MHQVVSYKREITLQICQNYGPVRNLWLDRARPVRASSQSCSFLSGFRYSNDKLGTPFALLNTIQNQVTESGCSLPLTVDGTQEEGKIRNSYNGGEGGSRPSHLLPVFDSRYIPRSRDYYQTRQEGALFKRNALELINHIEQNTAIIDVVAGYVRWTILFTTPRGTFRGLIEVLGLRRLAPSFLRCPIWSGLSLPLVEIT